MEFNEKIMDHFEHPRNVGTMDENDPAVGSATITAGQCGDVTRLQLRIDETERIVDVKFKTIELRDSDIAKELSLPPIKVHCSVLTGDAVRAAIEDWKRKNGRQ